MAKSLLWRYDHYHSFTFKPGHLFNFPIIDNRLRKLQENQFALFLINDRTAFKEHVYFHFCTILQKLDRVIQFKVEIVIIGVRTQANLFNYDLRRFGFHFLLFLLQLIKEFLIIHNFADRRIGGW